MQRTVLGQPVAGWWPGRRRRPGPTASGTFLYINILLVLLHNALFVGGLRKGRLVLPASYTALGDDLDVQLHADPLELATVERLRLEISRHLPGSGTGTVATTLDLRVDANHNVTQIKVPCYHFLHGGHYELAVMEENASHQMDERLRQPLNVSWPPVRLAIVPNRTETYPEQPIQGLLEFPGAHCQLPAHGADTLDLPELWLELFYCGKSVESCTVHGNGSQPFSRAQVLYTEQVRGLPRSRTLNFRCDLFGLAGFYALHLKPRPGELADPTMASLLQTRALLQTDWSKQYVFTVHTRSIFPCDPHGPGIRVLFQYPACILNQADRVRVYAKLRVDVLSLAPPTSLHYIAEQRVSKGQHSLYFECDLFYEKFVEYCFVYVSQAISGAVADIRMDCVPTLPVSASDSGGWGPWSNWTHCSTTCRGGIRNRYRFCDSPPPRYGAKFCEGASVQTERCGLDTAGDSWECMFSPAIGGINLPLEIEDVNTEIGPGCRCGCVIHLGMVKPKRLLGSSSHSCPDRSLWLIKGDEGCRVRMSIDFQKFPCDGQWLKIRDGDSVADELLLQFGADRTAPETASAMAEATGNMLLVEFFSRKSEQYDESCNAGFLGQAEQIKLDPAVSLHPTGNSTTIASKVIMPIVASLQSYTSFTIAHVCAIAFICFIVFVSFLLVVQYIFRYRKYELATSRMEAADSPAHTLFGSNQSVDQSGGGGPMHPRSRAVSTTTLISEIVSYVKLRPRVTTTIRHERFRESVEYALESANSQSETVRSDGSTEIVLELQDRSIPTDGEDREPHDRGEAGDEETPLQSLNDLNKPKGEEIVPSLERLSPDKEAQDTDDERSTTISSAYSSLNRENTPLVGGKSNKAHIEKLRTGDQLVKSATCLMATSSTSTATLTNVSPSDAECCSPPLDPSIRSPLARRNTGTSVRARNAKESKEKRNLQKLLAGSDYSLGAPSEQDMELDYYDYNVINAGAAPGSYLGMDPAFLVWIPPLDDGSENEDHRPSDGDDDDDELTELANRAREERNGGCTESRSDSVTPSEELIRQLAAQKRNDYVIVSSSISKSDICSESDGGASTDGKPPAERQKRRKLHELILVRRSGGSGSAGDNGSGSSVRKSSSDESTEEREKETSFTKSPVDNKQISDFYEMADIAFADDEADEEEEEEEEEKNGEEMLSGGFDVDRPKGGTILVSASAAKQQASLGTDANTNGKYQTTTGAAILLGDGEKIVQ
uniref:CUB domain-containing protein n=1 Tax=Anopheles arabiensis TaxID=7173 RepID=A0A499FTS2_ANOAR